MQAKKRMSDNGREHIWWGFPPWFTYQLVGVNTGDVHKNNEKKHTATDTVVVLSTVTSI